MTHCKTKTKQGKSKQGTFWYQCEICGMNGKGATDEEAQEAFRKSKPKPKQAPTELMVLPKKPTDMETYVKQHITDMRKITAPFVSRDLPRFDDMINRNIRYIMNNKDEKFIACFKTEEGGLSITEAFRDAISLGATLPSMGSIVPFGGVVEFIPAIEAFEFALVTGDKTAPFVKTQIDPIYPNQQYKCNMDSNGNFNFEFTSLVIPTGDIAGVVVRAWDKEGKIIGRLYSADQLLAKAKAHSKSYKAYLQDVQAFEYAQSEGTIKTDGIGRDYIDKKIEYTKNGQKKSFMKQIYRDDLQNPYDGADRPEMLRKTAGKSFFSPFIKIRNSVAAMEELRTEESEGGDIDSMLDGAIDSAMDNLSVEDTEYEIILEDGPDEEAKKEAGEETEPEEKTEQKKADAKSDKQDDLF